MEEKIDEVIGILCDWIKDYSSKDESKDERSILPDMTEALAELISARGQYN